jgi:hypothetical protein
LVVCPAVDGGAGVKRRSDCFLAGLCINARQINVLHGIEIRRDPLPFGGPFLVLARNVVE